jgi:hypothetical protein
VTIFEKITPDHDKRPGLDASMRLEVQHILASNQFKKAPTLERLLAFLVNETLNGNGKKLKSYAVAVDGLGRSPEFDTQMDSYPRVQVLRLRKMLEAFYSRHAPVADLCIYVPAGSYDVRLARPAIAYPELFRPLDDMPLSGSRNTVLSPVTADFERPQGDVAGRALSAPVAEQSITRRHPIFLRALLSLLLLFSFIAVYLSLFGPSDLAKNGAPTGRQPVMLLQSPSNSPDPDSKRIADGAYATLADGIGRSWLVRLRVDQTSQPAQSEPDYNLAVQVGQMQSGKRPLYLRLTDNRSDELVWSNTNLLDPNMSMPESLGKSIAQVAGPFGVIATRETRRLEGAYSPGYSCLLGYLASVDSQDSGMRERLSSCLVTPIEDFRLNAVRLGFMAFHLLETAPTAKKSEALAEALAHAQRAIKSDPKEAYAHFAMARTNFVANDCTKGKLNTQHAVDANPYDPIILAVLGNFAMMCGDANSDMLLVRALQLRSPGESYARLSLILAAIQNGKVDQLQSLSAEPVYTPGRSAAYHYLCETLIAAASDRPVKAREQWRKFAAASATPQGMPDDMMKQIVLSPQIRERIEAYLKGKDILPAKTIK